MQKKVLFYTNKIALFFTFMQKNTKHLIKRTFKNYNHLITLFINKQLLDYEK